MQLRDQRWWYSRCSPFSGPQYFKIVECPQCRVNKILLPVEVWNHKCPSLGR